MTRCHKCGAEIVMDGLAMIEIRYNGVNNIKRVCKKCAFIVDEFTDPAPLPDFPSRSRLDALFDYVEREKIKSPKEKIMEIVAGMYRKGYTVGAIAKETGLKEDSVMFVIMDAEGEE